MNGRQFARLILALEPDEQALDVAVLVDLYDGPACRDCGGRHLTVPEALACDDFSDARRRRHSRRRARAIEASTSR